MSRPAEAPGPTPGEIILKRWARRAGSSRSGWAASGDPAVFSRIFRQGGVLAPGPPVDVTSSILTHGPLDAVNIFQNVKTAVRSHSSEALIWAA